MRPYHTYTLESPYHLHPGSMEPPMFRQHRFENGKQTALEEANRELCDQLNQPFVNKNTLPGAKVQFLITNGEELFKFKVGNKMKAGTPRKQQLPPQQSPRDVIHNAQRRQMLMNRVHMQRPRTAGTFHLSPLHANQHPLTSVHNGSPTFAQKCVGFEVTDNLPPSPASSTGYAHQTVQVRWFINGRVFVGYVSLPVVMPLPVQSMRVEQKRVNYPDAPKTLRIRNNMTAATGSPASRHGPNGELLPINNGRPVICEAVDESPLKFTTKRSSAADMEVFEAGVSSANSDQSSMKGTDVVSFKSSIMTSGVPLGDAHNNAPGLVGAFIESTRLKASATAPMASTSHNNKSSTGSAGTDLSAQVNIKYETFRVAETDPKSPPFSLPQHSRGNNNSRPMTANTGDTSWPPFPPARGATGLPHPNHNIHTQAGPSTWNNIHGPASGTGYRGDAINIYRAAASENVSRGLNFMKGGIRPNKGMLSYAQDAPVGDARDRTQYAGYVPHPYGPIGSRLSPTAAEFSAQPGASQPWNPSHLGKHVFLHPYQQVNWRHLLEPGVTADWDLVVDKIISSNDQQASIFLQQKIKNSDNSIKDEIIKSIISRGLELMGNRFGNFLIQRVFECASSAQIMGLADHIRGHTVRLSTDAFGCHVVQKAFDCVPEPFKFEMVGELLTRIGETVVHRYACHVWQKLFELRWLGPPPMIMGTVNKALRGNWTTVALGETGSLVVQNIFENCGEEDKRPCIDEVIANLHIIARGQFGNWCIQHICEHGSPTDRNNAIGRILANASEYSMDQYASKVIEKCLKVCGTEFLEDYLTSVLTRLPGDNFSSLVQIARDQYGNFLIQWILNNANPHLRDVVQAEIRKHLVSLRGNKYGSKVALSCGYGPQNVRPGPPFVPPTPRQNLLDPRGPPPQAAPTNAYTSYYRPAYGQLDGAGPSYPPASHQPYGYYPGYH